MYTDWRGRPIPSSIMRVRSWPARPTNGTPCASSSAPGASPMNMIFASGEPSAKTVCLRVLQRRQETQEETSFAKEFRSTAEARRADGGASGYGAFSSKVNEADGAGCSSLDCAGCAGAPGAR